VSVSVVDERSPKSKSLMSARRPARTSSEISSGGRTLSSNISISARIVTVDIMSSQQVTRARVAAEARLKVLPGRLTHVRGVAAAADGLRGQFDVASGDRLVAAAWLHDIGYAPSVRSTGFHPVDGAAFARREGFDELVVSLVAFHSGAPAEARERGINGLSAFSAPPQQLLDALTFCDLTTGPDGSAVSPRDRLHEVLQRYGPDDPVHRAIDSVHRELLAAVDRVRAWL
jgi:HD domain